MPTLSADTERLLTEFAGKSDVTTDQVDNLRKAIANSPALATQVDLAITAGHLQRFELLPADSNVGGEYVSGAKAIRLPASSLSTLATPDKHDAAELTFVLGHEIQHGLNDAATERAYEQFESDIADIAARDSTHDYTQAIGTLLAANRRDEASANIEGWNALVGMVKTANPDATLEDVYNASTRANEFVRVQPGPPMTYAAHPDLTLNADLSMTATAANIEGMGKHYYDEGVSSGLGPNGNSDYQNFYAASAISRACEEEAKNPAPDGISRMSVNMAHWACRKACWNRTGCIWARARHHGSPTSTPAPRRPRCTISTTPRAPTPTCPSLHRQPHPCRPKRRLRRWRVATTVPCTIRSAARWQSWMPPTAAASTPPVNA